MAYAGDGRPARLGAPVPSQVETVSSEQPTRGTKVKKVRFPTLADGQGPRRWWIETIGLVAILVIGLGVLAYMLWPPGAEYLYQHAERLMAEKDPSAWGRADREYLIPLDRRFPDLYREQKQAWRDRIALERIRRRASTLEKPNLGRLSEPKDENEQMFVSVFNEAAGALKAGQDREAARKWQGMAETLKPDDPEDRPWRLLALERAEKLTQDMEQRRSRVQEMLKRAALLESEGKSTEAEQIRRDAAERYGSYRDLRDLIHGGGEDETKMPDKKED
jgi:hypothetical protein